jgi:hypothetical protein
LNFENDADRKIDKYFSSTIEGRNGLGFKGKSKSKKSKFIAKMSFTKGKSFKSDFT